MRSPTGKLKKNILCTGCGEIKKIPVFSNSDICEKCQDKRGEQEANAYVEKINTRLQ